MNFHPHSIEELSELVAGRKSDLFLPDLELRRAELCERVRGRRILVIGGGGSIGSATVRALIVFRPRSVHVVDLSESYLAELVRDLRSAPNGLSVADFRTLPVDYGSRVMQRFLKDGEPYDMVLNFAALKHVRSEKDLFSLLQMLDTNLVKNWDFLGWLAEKNACCRFFCVSSDKAANPVSLMGASKRIMEHLIFSHTLVPGLNLHVTSARFANVAFSNGSLLTSFLFRLQRRQPLAAPRNTLRYFITLREAAQICLLAAVCGPNSHLLVPRLDPDRDLRDLATIAALLLRHHGLEPRVYEDEKEAKENLHADLAKGSYPVLLTPLNTSGEKPYEEFLGDAEEAVEVGLPNLVGVPHQPCNESRLRGLLESIRKAVCCPDTALTKEELALRMSEVIPNLRHLETGKNLDQRM